MVSNTSILIGVVILFVIAILRHKLRDRIWKIEFYYDASHPNPPIRSTYFLASLWGKDRYAEILRRHYGAKSYWLVECLES